jgi:sigma-B regulation protein RsbU (phosphoserine phosphatase)
MLGATDGTDFHEETVRLLPGDVVIAASDGILRAHDATGREFGTQKVEEIALEQRRQPLDQLADAITRGALEHGASGIPADDLTVVALRYSRDG